MIIMINKRMCICYDTFQDMVNDTDIYDNMVVMTLGYKDINDGSGNIYRICTKDYAMENGVKGEPLSKTSKFFAMYINQNSDKKYDNLLSRINKLEEVVYNG